MLNIAGDFVISARNITNTNNAVLVSIGGLAIESTSRGIRIGFLVSGRGSRIRLKVVGGGVSYS